MSLPHSLMEHSSCSFAVPAGTLVETYPTSTQYLMLILFTNSHTLLHMHNSIIISHIHDFFSLIMVQIFN